MIYSAQERLKHTKAVAKETREERRKRLRSWSGMAGALLNARGGDASKYSEARLAMMFYRRRKQPISQVTQNRFAAQARKALLKTLETQNA